MGEIIGSIVGGGMGIAGAAMSSAANEKIERAKLKAAIENRNFDLGKLNQGAARNLALMLGPAEAEKVLRGTFSASEVASMFRDPNTTRARAGYTDELAQIEQALAPYARGKGIDVGTTRRATGLNTQTVRKTPAGYDRTRATAAGVDIDKLLARKTELDGLMAGNPDNPEGIDLEAFRAMGPGVNQGYDDLITRAETEGAGAIGRFDTDSTRLMKGARAIEGQARNFGQQERERIYRDSDRALTGLNRATESRLMGRGLGASTILTGSLRANTNQMGENRANALGSLGDRQIGLQTSLAGNTLNMDAARSGQRLGLTLANQDRTGGYRQNALTFRQNALSGATMNPWLSRSTGQYFPGNSPSGAAGQTWGNFISQLGGQGAAGGWGNFGGGSGGSYGNTNGGNTYEDFMRNNPYNPNSAGYDPSR